MSLTDLLRLYVDVEEAIQVATGGTGQTFLPYDTGYARRGDRVAYAVASRTYGAGFWERAEGRVVALFKCGERVVTAEELGCEPGAGWRRRADPIHEETLTGTAKVDVYLVVEFHYTSPWCRHTRRYRYIPVRNRNLEYLSR
jgi:hypothetical protein